jgi:tRNA nucleotidyltransferase (CCA-adding enzyme)
MEFLKDPKLIKLTNAFKADGFEVRVVGGAVRDWLQGVAPKDVDLCTNATPDEMITVAERHKLNFVPTGLQHGTITFVIDKEPFEVTTLRIDVETDGRHAEVAFTRDFEKDAERRDLTINAMSVDMDGNVFDYFSGREHLASGKICFVGNAEDRIREDYLRVLRFFRFRSKITHSPLLDDEFELFSQQHVLDGIKRLSGERLWSELKKIAANEFGRTAFHDLVSTGLGKAIFGEVCDFNFMSSRSEETFVVYRSIMRKYPKGYDRLKEVMVIGVFAGLVHPFQVKGFAELMKLSSDERNILEYTSRVFWYDDFINSGPFFNNCSWLYGEVANGVQPSLAIFRLYGHFDTAVMLEDVLTPSGDIQYINGAIPFTLSGKDLIQRGVKPGKVMGSMISMARDFWMHSGCRLENETLLDMVTSFDKLDEIVSVRYNVVDMNQAIQAGEYVKAYAIYDHLMQEKQKLLDEYPTAVAVVHMLDLYDGMYMSVLYPNNKVATLHKLTENVV